MASFGERLRELRLAAGLSQAELAGDDLSASYVSLMEAGKRRPSDEVVQQLAVRLGCSTTQLLEGKPSERDQRINLEMAFARLAIEHGEALDARGRLERLLTEDGLSLRATDEIRLLLASACERSGDLTAAVQVYLTLFERACANETHLLINTIGTALCGCYIDAGDLAQAVRVGEQALTAARAQGLAGTDDYYRLAATVIDAYMNRGDFTHARVWAEELLGEAQQDGRHIGQAAIYWNSALLAEREGRIADALHLSERALGHLSELDDGRDFARLRLAVAGILLADEPPKTDRAENLLQRCLDDLGELGSRVDLAWWNQAMSQVLLFKADPTGAETRARQALDLVVRASPATRALILLALSDALAAQGKDGQAHDARMRAFADLDTSPPTRSTALEWREVGERMASSADLRGALEAFRRAMDGAGVRDRSRTARDQVAALRARPSVSARQDVPAPSSEVDSAARP